MNADPSTDDTAGTTSKARLPSLDAGTIQVNFNFEPLRGHGALYQCSACWAVVHFEHITDHAGWHGTILHVARHDG